MPLTFASSLVSISTLAAMDRILDNPYLIASFGATAVLIYGAPEARFSRPKNVILGHLFSALVGVSITYMFGTLGIMDGFGWLMCGLAVSIAILVMSLTGTIHPPGGATALTCAMSGFSSVEYVFRPVMLGVLLMMLIAYMANGAKDSLLKGGPENR